MKASFDEIENGRRRERIEDSGMLRSSPLGTWRYKAQGSVGNVFGTAQEKGGMAYRRDSERVLLLIRHFLILHFTHAHNLRRGAEFLVVAEGLFHVHVEVLYQGQSYVDLRRQVER
jgi:hypothetical protein